MTDRGKNPETPPFDCAAWRAKLDTYLDIPFMEDGRDQGSILDEDASAQSACLDKHADASDGRLSLTSEGKVARGVGRADIVIFEPLQKPPFDFEAWCARSDALGGADFCPDGPPDDPPSQPDRRVFFDEGSPNVRERE